MKKYQTLIIFYVLRFKSFKSSKFIFYVSFNWRRNTLTDRFVKPKKSNLQIWRENKIP